MKEKTKPLPWPIHKSPAFQVARRMADLSEVRSPLTQHSDSNEHVDRDGLDRMSGNHAKSAPIETKAERTGKQRQDTDYDVKPALQKQTHPHNSSHQKKKR